MNRTKNRPSILLFCPHFEPDLQAATGEVMTQLVEGLAELDHRISVVTSLPWYRHHAVEPEWKGRPWRRQRTDWGQIIRTWPFPTNKTNVPARAGGFAAQTALAAGIGIALGHHDVVMGMTPPIFFGDAAWLAARRFGAPMVFNTQDIFPDVAVELGALTNERVIDWARRHERSLYRRSDVITVLSEDQAVNVRAKLDFGDSAPDGSDKVKIIHNFVDTDRIRPAAKQNWYRQRHRLEGKTVIMYSGNVGLSQSFELVRTAALRWQNNPEVVFVINGEGAGRADVERWSADLPNVLTVDFSPRDQVPDVLAAADLHLILLKSGLARSSTPSKLYGILAAGRPVLASIDQGSEVATVLDRAKAGVAVPPDDPKLFCDALHHLIADPAEMVSMGLRARDFAEAWLSPRSQAGAYGQLFVDLCSAK